jgi:hypothetical protein
MFRGNEKWLAVLQDLDCVDMLSQILLIPDFTARYANNNNNNNIHSTLHNVNNWERKFHSIKDNLQLCWLVPKLVGCRACRLPQFGRPNIKLCTTIFSAFSYEHMGTHSWVQLNE